MPNAYLKNCLCYIIIKKIKTARQIFWKIIAGVGKGIGKQAWKSGPKSFKIFIIFDIPTLFLKIHAEEIITDVYICIFKKLYIPALFIRKKIEVT